MRFGCSFAWSREWAEGYECPTSMTFKNFQGEIRHSCLACKELGKLGEKENVLVMSDWGTLIRCASSTVTQSPTDLDRCRPRIWLPVRKRPGLGCRLTDDASKWVVLIGDLVDSCREVELSKDQRIRERFSARAKAGGWQARAIEGGWLTGDVVPCISFARTVRTDWAVRRDGQERRW